MLYIDPFLQPTCHVKKTQDYLFRVKPNRVFSRRKFEDVLTEMRPVRLVRVGPVNFTLLTRK